MHELHLTQKGKYRYDQFTDIIKGKFLEEFSAISLTGALSAIMLAFVLSLFIVFIYRTTYAGVNYSRNFTACLMMLSMVTALVAEVRLTDSGLQKMDNLRNTPGVWEISVMSSASGSVL